jgi:hypothetical protein
MRHPARSCVPGGFFFHYISESQGVLMLTGGNFVD